MCRHYKQFPTISSNYPTSSPISCSICSSTLPRSTLWCNPCQAARFTALSHTWTSDHPLLDRYILSTQQEATSCVSYLEYIPHQQLAIDFTIDETEYSDFARVLIGYWIDGPADTWSGREKKFVRGREYVKIAFISYKCTEEEFVEELRLQFEARKQNLLMTRVFGATYCSLTQRFCMIIESAEWDLRRYISHLHTRLEWSHRLLILHTLTSAILYPDKYQYYQPLYEGEVDNVIFRSHTEVPLREMQLDTKSYGIPVIGSVRFDISPYIPPEFLISGKKESGHEVYTISMIMFNLICNEPILYSMLPQQSSSSTNTFSPSAYSSYLSSSLRPLIPDFLQSIVPSFYISLMMQCWSHNPCDRPSIATLHDILTRWRFDPIYESEFQEAESKRFAYEKSKGNDPSEELTLPSIEHPMAVGIARPIRYLKMPKVPPKRLWVRQEKSDIWRADRSFFNHINSLRPRTFMLRFGYDPSLSNDEKNEKT
ncbi:6205_t:CDS:2 [Paraglomus brasilianum]|uniref:6205_t:CDS:1 n=1 Tax=Paraglomus brasilianum TaxID=144538 RepID=A0A9N8WLF7_9GLOM|nr:6205_t:CDS:2 [Paraglomus brasilianum]